MAHSDVGEDALPARVWRELRRRLGADTGDALVVIWAPEQDVATAVREVFLRAAEALVGVPAETRQAYADGTTGFERILPGPDRMYPDTDTPPLPIRDELLEKVRASLPSAPWVREQRYVDLGLHRVAAQQLASSPWADLFDAGAARMPETARRLAASLRKRVPYHMRLGNYRPREGDSRLRQVVATVEAGTVRPEAMDRLVDRLLRQPDATADEILAPFRMRPDDPEHLRRSVGDLATRARALAGKGADTMMRWAMGEVMPTFLGRIEPAVVRRRIADALHVPEAAA
jgi:glutamyl-tRNA(Gln) amidotransferase subunit E